jgi:hypothetical protein
MITLKDCLHYWIYILLRLQYIRSKEKENYIMKNKVMMPSAYEGYSVDEDGRLYSHKSGRYLKPFDNGHGYLYYNI